MTIQEQYENLEKTVRGYNPAADFQHIRAAFEFAAEAHKDQKRKSGEPYIIHPLAVAQIIAEEQRHGVRVAESIELLDEADGSAALFGGVIEPLAAADGDAVVAGKAFVPAGCDELFSSAAEELLQVHRRGSFFLLGCKRNVL